jgi:RNA recognition motif-containing protein
VQHVIDNTNQSKQEVVKPKSIKQIDKQNEVAEAEAIKKKEEQKKAEPPAPEKQPTKKEAKK